jgi:glycosyltransferase involved in cell wall biosynthesis
MQVHVLSLGDETTASTHFRFLQYADLLKDRGIELILVRRSDVGPERFEALRDETVVLQKIILRPGELRKLRECAGRLVFDFDDAIWTRLGRPFSLTTRLRVQSRLARCIRAADTVTVANEYLADFARRYNPRCEQIPMAIDLDTWTPRTNRPSEANGERTGVVIGWTGGPANLRFLEPAIPALARLCRERNDVEVRIYCGERPELPFDFRHTEYRPGTEASFVRDLDIGLCPLEDHEFTRGKSPIKILQYLSCEVPAVATGIGASLDLLDPDWSRSVAPGEDWYPAIAELAESTERRRDMGRAGRAYVESTHDLYLVADQLAEVLRGETRER